MNDNDLLNGRRFVMLSSTAGRVDPDGPTEFSYRETGGIVWGDYAGDTVVHGRFVGTRDADRIETLPGGRLRLVEEFRFAGDDTPHVSVCAEIV